MSSHIKKFSHISSSVTYGRDLTPQWKLQHVLNKVKDHGLVLNNFDKGRRVGVKLYLFQFWVLSWVTCLFWLCEIRTFHLFYFVHENNEKYNFSSREKGMGWLPGFASPRVSLSPCFQLTGSKWKAKRHRNPCCPK